jgi:hypothetical protein
MGPRIDVFLLGGSHLGSAGLPPTANFAVLLSRRLRASLGPSFGRTRSIFYEGDVADVPGLLPDPLPEGAVVFVLPRNLLLVPMIGELRGAAARLRGGRRIEFRSVFEPADTLAGEIVRRLRLLARQVVGNAYAGLNLPLLARRSARRGAELDGVVERLRARGSRLVVLATPIPLSSRHFPMARFYQGRYADLVRRRRAPGVEIADLFAALGVEGRGFVQPRDPLHLTVEGHQRVAAVLGEVIEAALGDPEAKAAERPREPQAG